MNVIMADLDLDLQTGEQRLGPYRLLRPISAGGMARVYEGRLDSLAGVSTRVAVKVIHPDFASDAGFQDLFVTEARISARLEHQNLVRVQQFNREGDLLYLVMEFIDGFTLRKLISHSRRNGLGVPTSLIAEIGRQVCEGLHYAHQLAGDDGGGLRLVHRDVKPSNLMVNRQGVVKVLDFGISSAQGSEERVEGREGVKGTWGYMSLEQAHGEAVGPAADIFGLGAVLYELATGEALFPERDNDEIRTGLIRDEAARRAAAKVRADLAPVLIRALQRDPTARFPSAASFGRALGALVGDGVLAHEGLIQLAGELRSAEGSVQAGARDSARSVSTIGPGAVGVGAGGAGSGGSGARGLGARGSGQQARGLASTGLPVSVGDAHGPRVERRPATASRRPSVLWAGALGAFGFAALLIMTFAAWQLYRSAGAAPPAATAPPDLSVLAEPAAPKAPAAAKAVSPASPARSTRPASTIAAPSAIDPPPPTSPPAPASPPALRTETAVAPTPRVVPTSPREQATPIAAVGYLSIGSEPAADVLIDGSFVKRTPMLRYPINAGQH
ncbi:MAG: serine/threonine protein kinase, partial [Myxococcales bacterium]|nr:serine/threonine protein kinase [Myxococcales bacterium]